MKEALVRVNIDVETRSTVDLRRTSAKFYARHPDTDIILVRYGDEARIAAGEEPKEWLCYRGPMPRDLFDWLLDPAVRLVAHNAGFEHAILTAPHLREKYTIPEITLDRWDDTAARAARQALPRSLEGVAQALGLPVKKDMEGARIMQQLCKPRSWTEDDEPVWWTPEGSPEKYAKLSDYCSTDVKVGASLSTVTRPLPERERAIWLMTEEINETGLYVDWRFAEAAAKVARLYLRYLDHQMAVVTNGEVRGATKVVHLKEWCAARGYVVYDSLDDEKIILDKGAVAQLLERDDLPPDVRAALEIRRRAARNSVAKYDAILNRVERSDSRVRDTLVYHGASTGRWAGAGIQPQNFPRNVVSDWEGCAADIYLLADQRMTFEDFEQKHGADVMTMLSRMLRGTITAPEGRGLIFPDFSAIEARGVAWVAGADKLTKLFAAGGKVYEEFASSVYGIPVTEITKDSPQRFLAKTAVLGAGYGMGPPKFVATCEAQNKIISLEDAETVIQAYRAEYYQIPMLWRGLEEAAISAVQRPGKEVYYHHPGGVRISFNVRDGFLLMKLPSGRLLFYREPRVIQVATPWGPRMALEYFTLNSVTRKWQRETTWGGRLTENCVQAVCRDLIAEAMLRLRAAGYTLVGTVHDEVIIETDDLSDSNVQRVLSIMTEVPTWAAGFPISAEAGKGIRYGK